ncbi:ABC transporter permease [Streptomyces sp. DSM 44917]|uniref:ABC transporter permease n=1 Tax=Streptomyces boetiae TaxID=3075541 RepID=A0ABU2L994_9ACTN|nr:ABC transporter permease [Streptomyces sp. DSM 44917]MDT0308146.1 ABC transporter permease [Streptomyces sp. DSM 44917]
MSSNLSTLTDRVRPRGRVEEGRRRGPRLPVVLLLLAGALLLLSVVRAVTDQQSVTSPDQWGAALTVAAPIALAGLGGLWAERAGVINIGLEGMMILGLFTAGAVGWQYGPWAAVAAGVAGGALGGLLHAVATVSFGVDHIVSGVAINISVPGIVQYLAKLWFAAEGSEAAARGGTDGESPQMERMEPFSVPGLSGWLGDLDERDWFLVSDAAGILRAAVHEVSWLTLITVLLFVGSYLVLWRSAFGLRLRSCGENPEAAESLGVNVYLYKYAALIVSGGLAGLGGGYLAVLVRRYLEGQADGRGYLGLATMIFGNWRPAGVASGAGLFGFMDVLQTRDPSVVHAMLLLFALALLSYVGWLLYRGRRTAALTTGAIGGLLWVWYAVTDSLPPELVEAIPYLTTLLVLTLFAQRLRPPKAIGRRYRRGEGG